MIIRLHFILKIMEPSCFGKDMETRDYENIFQQFHKAEREVDLSFLYMEGGIICFAYVEYVITTRLMKARRRNKDILFYLRSFSVS